MYSKDHKKNGNDNQNKNERKGINLIYVRTVKIIRGPFVTIVLNLDHLTIWPGYVVTDNQAIRETDRKLLHCVASNQRGFT